MDWELKFTSSHGVVNDSTPQETLVTNPELKVTSSYGALRYSELKVASLHGALMDSKLRSPPCTAWS